MKWYLNQRLLKNLKLSISLFMAVMKGEYNKKALISVFFPLLATIYLISPVDFLTDFFPILGFVDDLFLLILSFYFLERELKKYQTFLQKDNKQLQK